MSKKELDWLVSEKGVKAILSSTEVALPSEWLEQLEDYRHISIKNHTPPTVSQLADAVDFVNRNVREGRKTAVH
jgi:protein-tyrosine phosphatase